MNINLYTTFIILLILFFNVATAKVISADTKPTFDDYMLLWRENNSRSRNYLEEAIKELEAGSRTTACSKQKIASQYRIAAFEALIRAEELNQGDNIVINARKNFKTWEKIADC